MNTRKIATEYRMSQWTQRLRRKKSLGQSVKEFCETEGVSRNTYFYWQKRLREAAVEELSIRMQVGTNTAEKSLVPSGWAVCEAAEPERTVKPLTVEIGEYRVRVDAETDIELLAKVCRTLRTLC